MAGGGPDALLSRRAGAVLHGVEGIRRVTPDVTVPFGRLPVLPGVDWHRTRNLTAADRTVRDGIPVMALPRVLLELCGIPWLSFEVVEHAIQHSVITKKVRIEDLLAVLDRVGGRGVDGTVRFRTITTGGLPDETIQSMVELLLDRIVDSAAIPNGVRQHPLICVDGRRVVLDRAWPDLRIAAEADGLRWHGTAAQHRATVARSRSIQASGYLHLQYGWTDCAETPDDTRRELEATIGAALAA